MNIETTQISDVQISGVEFNQYPEFEDAYISECLIDEREPTDEEVEWINDNLHEFVQEEVWESLT